MRTTLLVVALSAAFPLTAVEPGRILWAGSSSVYFHDMPRHAARWLTEYGRMPALSEIVGRSGDSIQVYLSPGSFTPQYGLAAGQTFLDKIRDGRYPFVVLQVVTHFMTGPGGAELERALDTYTKAIKDAAGEPVFYEMGWGLEPENDLGREKIFQSAVRNRVRYIVPCSTAWKRVRAERPDLELHNLPDRSHPGTIGNYLNLVAFYSTFTGRKPDNLPLTISWWPAVSHDEKQQAKARIDASKSDAYFRALPEFLQVRSTLAREHTFDQKTAAYLQRVAWESYTVVNRRLQEALK